MATGSILLAQGANPRVLLQIPPSFALLQKPTFDVATDAKSFAVAGDELVFFSKSGIIQSRYHLNSNANDLQYFPAANKVVVLLENSIQVWHMNKGLLHSAPFDNAEGKGRVAATTDGWVFAYADVYLYIYKPGLKEKKTVSLESFAMSNLAKFAVAQDKGIAVVSGYNGLYFFDRTGKALEPLKGEQGYIYSNLSVDQKLQNIVFEESNELCSITFSN